MSDISSLYRWRRLTPPDAHCFFGYYDRNPWNADQSLHLALRVGQCDVIPVPGETAEVGVVSPEGGFTPLTETRAWCHQQGAMELFLPRRPGSVVYNDFDSGAGRLVARIFEPGRGVCGGYDRPLYAISPDGRHAVSLNFARIPRRGYSYADAPVPFDHWHPEDPEADGIFLIDLESGASRLLVSYRTMLERHPCAHTAEDQYIWLNHAIFNRDSTRLLWLLRQTTEPRHMSRFWRTYMYTCSVTDPSDVECILPDTCWRKDISHQIWGHAPREILIDARWGDHGFELVSFDESRRPFISRRISPGHGGMGHAVYSPDGRYILFDSYPSPDGRQTLHLVEAATGKCELLGTFNHRRPEGAAADTRCDLHPRWSPDGRMVTVDSIHDGRRGIYLLRL